MSSLTSIGINKNKKGFAPKITKRKDRKPAPTANGSKSDAKKPTSNEVRIVNNSSDDFREPAESIAEVKVTDSPAPIMTEASTFVEEDSLEDTKLEEFKRIQSSHSSNTQINDNETIKNDGLTEEELAINALASSGRKRRNGPEINIENSEEEDSDGPVVVIQPKKKFKSSTPVNEKPEKKVEKPKEKKTASSAKKSKGKPTTKGTAISIGIGIPGPSSSSTTTTKQAQNNDDDSDDPSYNDSIKIKKPHKFAYRLVENLRTLDDITNDPANIDNLDKPMTVFTKDIDGIVSRTFKEMEKTRDAIKKRNEAKSKMSVEELEALKRKEEEEERIAAEKRAEEKEREEARRREEAEKHVLKESSNAVQVRIVDGEIVLDTDTLVVERQTAANNLGDEMMEVVEENNLTKKVNSQTYGKRKQSARWNALETDKFYEFLSQFGTDFEMISKLMPGRTRNQIRTKFNKEEKFHPEKITEYLITKKKPMDLEKFKQIAGIELETVPEDFNQLQLV